MQHDTFEVASFPDLEKYAAYTSSRKLRLCIATEEILGPVRNGGIASTYYHLAKGLAAHGHEVHVLYLKGPTVENKTADHWVKHFAEFGVALHYLEHIPEAIVGPSQFWQQRYAAAYKWLKNQNNFDVVHTSEWRGGLVYALMAKKLGLAFKNTLFIVKTSSPHLWNRHYQMQPIEKLHLVAASFAEQKCVELADMVIGGSAHLLSFMRHVGYQLPAFSFVQPNILDFSEVKVVDKRPSRKPGDLVQSTEVTFFGRLEARKGIELFCSALDILERDGIRPKRVNFLGKYGAPLTNHANEKVEDFITRKSAGWKFEVNRITDLNQPEALSFLCSRDMLAVMPSLIENSTMAVYETLENRIPFIATDVGGTAELIATADHEETLIAPNAYELAQKLKHALTMGHRIAEPSFNNQKNLETWYGFHAYLADLFSKHSGEEAISRLTGEPKIDAKPEAETDSISLEAVVLLREETEAMLFAKSLLQDPPDHTTLLFTDPALEEAAHKMANLIKAAGQSVEALDCLGHAAGAALSEALRNSKYDACILCDGTATRFQEFFAELRVALQHKRDALITSFVQIDDTTIGMPIGNDVACENANGGAVGANILCVSKDVQQRVGELQPYDIRFGLLQEYALRAAYNHKIDLLVIPECRLQSNSYSNELERTKANPNSRYLRAMPLIEADDISSRKMGLLPISSPAGQNIKPNLYRDKKRRNNEAVWYIPSDRRAQTMRRPPKVFIGVDERKSRLLLVADGEGERSLFINGVRQEIVLKKVSGDLTLHQFDVPHRWEAGRVFHIKFILDYHGSKNSRYLRVIKMADRVFAAVSGAQIADAQTIAALFKKPIRTNTPASRLTKRLRSLVSSALRRSELKSIPKIGTWLKSGIQSVMRLRPHKVGRTIERKVSRTIRGYEGSPIRGSVPPKELFAINPETLSGWAWDRSDTSRTLTVVLELNERPVAETTADVVIERFGTRNRKLANHGFCFDLSPEMKVDGANIALKIKETGQVIRNGHLVYSAQMLVPSQLGISHENA
ncbi:glycosyltransferase family 4 protein [Pseudovibrio exalbescens]|uniref:glycosyltransferase family 4 protein n=1 Tax=Pseudovibrio exalbescens TaxID=197461 RepID=UPI002366C030|nr:glycosyltransferase family 4 protein [Pseudovibrio exalbescens]MDD7911561.1 glycosyltransferase family 4 protein [Pseudovibrio exalbescens]